MTHLAFVGGLPGGAARFDDSASAKGGRLQREG
jgi:hypothetical protein